MEEGDSHTLIMLLFVQVALIALNAVFACAEIAIISMNDTRMAKLASQGDKRALRLKKLTSQPARFLATIQVAITLSGFLGSAFAADNFAERLVDWVLAKGVEIDPETLESIAVVAITLVLSYVTLILGELVPKRLAMKHSEKLALGMAPMLCGVSKLFTPIVWFLSVSTNGVLRLCGVDPHEEEEEASEEEILLMVDTGSEKGTIDSEEREFIQNVFEFDDLAAGEIATHRTDAVLLWLEDDDETWEKTIHECRYTRFPICDGSPDNVVGILNAKEYFRLEDRSRENIMAQAVREPYFVPETIKADVLFRNMKKQHRAMAVVLDEYGGMAGIITLSDLVEELVGELGDEETDPRELQEGLEQVDEATWKVRGNVSLREIEEATGLTFDEGGYDTLTGLVFDVLGMIPQDGKQTIDLETGRLQIHVSLVKEHQVERAVLKVTPAEESEE